MSKNNKQDVRLVHNLIKLLAPTNKNNNLFCRVLHNSDRYATKHTSTMSVALNSKGTYNLHYNRKYIEKLSDIELQAVLMHEGGHIACNHCVRGMSFAENHKKLTNPFKNIIVMEPQLGTKRTLYSAIANIAMDLVINEIAIRSFLREHQHLDPKIFKTMVRLDNVTDFLERLIGDSFTGYEGTSLHSFFQYEYRPQLEYVLYNILRRIDVDQLKDKVISIPMPGDVMYEEGAITDGIEAAPGNNDSEGEESEGGDSEGEESEGEESEGGDSVGEESEGGDSEGGDSEGEESEGEESEGGDSEGEESEGEESEGEESEGEESEGGGGGASKEEKEDEGESGDGKDEEDEAEIPKLYNPSPNSTIQVPVKSGNNAKHKLHIHKEQKASRPPGKGSVDCSIDLYPLEHKNRNKSNWVQALHHYLDVSVSTEEAIAIAPHLIPFDEFEPYPAILPIKKLKPILIFQDVSGSISDHAYLLFMSEIQRIMKLLPELEIHLVQFTSHLCNHKHLKHPSEVDTKIRYLSGGTCYNDLFRYLNGKYVNLGIKPLRTLNIGKVCIMTDNECSIPRITTSPLPILWLFTKDHDTPRAYQTNYVVLEEIEDL
jgi:hypothetical protein